MKFSKKTFIIIGLVLAVIILLILFEKMYMTDTEIKRIKESQNLITKEKDSQEVKNAGVQYIEDGYEIEIDINTKIKKD